MSFGPRCSGATAARRPNVPRSRAERVGRSGCATGCGIPRSRGSPFPRYSGSATTSRTRSRRVATVLLAKDFIRYRLTGTLATEPSDASGTLMFDPARLRWSDDILHATDVPRALLPDVGGSAEVLGRVTRRRRSRAPASRRARRSSAEGPTTRAAPLASAWSLRARPSRAGARPAPCSRPLVSRSLIRGFARTRSAMWLPACGTSWAWCSRLVERSPGTAISWRASSRLRPAPTRRSMQKRRAFRAGAEGVTFLPVSPGRADAASGRVGARRFPRTQSRAYARPPHACGARGDRVRAS